MANGLYGRAAPAANTVTATKVTNTSVPAGKVRTVNVGVCNTTGFDAKIWIAFSAAADGDSIPVTDWKVSGRSLKATLEYERTNQVLAAGENVWVKTSIDGIAFDVRGFEGAA